MVMFVVVVVRGIVVTVKVGAVFIRGISVELRYWCRGRGEVICVFSRLRGITGLSVIIVLSGVASLSGIAGLSSIAGLSVFRILHRGGGEI